MSLTTSTDVLDFINGFYEHDRGCVIHDTFMNGYCYYFAIILKERFEGRILYAPYEGHFVTEINQMAFDVTGNVSGRYKLCENWNEKSIIEGCILKKQGEEWWKFKQ